MPDWKDKLLLQQGERLQLIRSSTEGFMGETDVETYEVVALDNARVGVVVFKDHTAVRGFRRTLSVEQRNLAGEVVVHKAWKG